MKFTLALAMCEPAHYLPLAVAAEQHGWHALAVPDSVFFPERVSAPYPYMPDGKRFWTAETPWIEPLVAIPAMAAVTQRLRFYTNVLKLPIRSPLLVAKQVGSIAVLSGNRVGLGVGLSWIPEEFAWLGQDYATRGARVDEGIEILRVLLRGGMVEHRGKHYDFGPLQMSPAPSAPVPIYVGGQSPPGLRRAARLGDGWISAQNSEAELRRLTAELHSLRREHGREREPFEIKVTPTDVFDVDGYRRLEELGVSDVITMPWYFYPGDREKLETRRAALQRFADQFIAKLS